MKYFNYIKNVVLPYIYMCVYNDTQTYFYFLSEIAMKVCYLGRSEVILTITFLNLP